MANALVEVVRNGRFMMPDVSKLKCFEEEDVSTNKNNLYEPIEVTSNDENNDLDEDYFEFCAKLNSDTLTFHPPNIGIRDEEVDNAVIFYNNNEEQSVTWQSKSNTEEFILSTATNGRVDD